HIPVGWWPSAIQVSADGNTLYVANARGRGAPANNGNGSPKSSTLGTVNIIPVPGSGLLQSLTTRVLKNNGFVPGPPPAGGNPIPNTAGAARLQAKRISLLKKKNSTYHPIFG